MTNALYYESGNGSQFCFRRLDDSASARASRGWVDADKDIFTRGDDWLPRGVG